MKIRHLKQKLGGVIDSVWPPQWMFSMHPRGGDEILVGDEAVLESVKRMGELSLTMKYKGVFILVVGTARRASGHAGDMDANHIHACKNDVTKIVRGLHRNPWRTPPRDHGKSPDQVVHTIEDFRKSGLEHLALSFRDVRLFRDETPDLLLKQMWLFAGEIMPAFRT
jgi:hypothetical protein